VCVFFLTHFLPSKLRRTYSYAQVKFEKNEWCHKKNHKKIIYTPILILFSGNVLWCLFISLTITCLPNFWLKGFVYYLFKNESISLQRAKLGVGLQNRTLQRAGLWVCTKWVNFSPPAVKTQCLSVSGIPAPCEKFPHSIQLNFWITFDLLNRFSISLVCF
jgi:hypothetical protein